MTIESAAFDQCAAVHAANRRPLVAVLIAFAGGIILDRFALCGLGGLGFWCLAGLTLLAIWLVLHRQRLTRAAAIILLLVIASVGGGWHHLRWHLFDSTDIGRYAGAFPQRVALRVETTEPVKNLPAPERNPLWTMPTGHRSRVEVRVLAIRDRQRWKDASGKAMLLVDGEITAYRPGTRLEIFGRMLRPPPANNRGEFDFVAYRRMHGQHCVLRSSHPACLQKIGVDSRLRPSHWFANIRAYGSQLLWSYLDHQRAGLAAAVLLGEREQLEHDRTEAFIKTGTIHLLAISGLHIGILVGLLFVLLRFAALPRGLLLIAIALLTVFYALLTDARPPVMRATVLVVVLCVALQLARQLNPLNALALAALIVLSWNPSNLFRVGSQLSFLAVATLIFLEPIRQQFIKKRRDPLQVHIARSRPWPLRLVRKVGAWFWQLSLAGLVVFLVALPLVMLHFHLFTPVGVLLTPLLYLPLALALASGLGILLTGWLLPPIAICFAMVCDLNLGILEWGVTKASQLPFSYAYVAGPMPCWTILFYLGVALCALLPRYRPPRTYATGLLGLWIVVGFFYPSHARATETFRCTFIDVGQGLSVLLELPEGNAILYDAGRMGSPAAAVRAISTTLWSRGRTHLDAVIVSHADADHFNAIPELLERFSVGVIYMSPSMLRKKDAATLELLMAIEQNHVPVRGLWQGCFFNAAAARLSILHPTGTGITATRHGSVDNANSLVLLVEAYGRRLLLTGDIESTGLSQLLQHPALDCDLILAPHHGSPKSRPADVVSWCQPQITVISSGLTPPNQEVHDAYTAGSRMLLHTGACGAIEATLGTEGVRIETQHGKNR